MKREWYPLESQGALHPKRVGRVTASVQKGLAMGEKTAGYNEVIDAIVAERWTGKPPSDRYYGGYMERGHALEPYNVEQYEIDTFSCVSDGGFFTAGDDYGASPDGCVDGHGLDCTGLFEGKALKYTTHMRVLRTQEIPKEFIWQMPMQMFVANKPWVDFRCYHPDYPPFHKRIERDTKVEKELVSRLKIAVELIEERLAALIKNYG